MLPIRLLVAVVLCLFAARVVGQTTAPAYEESNDGLKKWATDLLKTAETRDQAKTLAIFQDFMLKDPEAYFTQVFGPEIGERLAKEYKTDLPKFPASMTGLFLRLDKPTDLSIDVVSVDRSDDPNAKDFQIIALAAMQQPVTLYSLRLYKAGTTASIGIWSIVYREGSWRFAGKMRTVRG